MITVGKLLYNKRSRSIIFFVIGLFFFVIFMAPLYWMLASSFKGDAEVFHNPPTLWPHKLYLDGYINQITPGNPYFALRYALNSLIISLCNMALSFVLAVPAAYSLARFKLPGRRGYLFVFLITQMLPASLLLTPLFLVFSRIGVLNSYIGPVVSIATISIPFTVILLRPMFLACPVAVEESARIDGCSRFGTFLRITLPMVQPGVVTCLCFSFVHGWSDLIFSLTFNAEAALYPMTAAIYNLMTGAMQRWNWVMAFGVIMALPPTLIFIFGQKYIVNGISAGSVKA
jgi:multiple sugar transport system permease protein